MFSSQKVMYTFGTCTTCHVDTTRDKVGAGGAAVCIQESAPGAPDSSEAVNAKIQSLRNNPVWLSNEKVTELQQLFLLSCGKYVKGKRNVSVGAAKEVFGKAMAHNIIIHEYFNLVSTGGDKIDIDPIWFDCNATDEDGWSVLHHASGEGKLDIVQWLCGLTTPDALMNTPHSTLFRSKFSIHMDTQADDQCTPLWVAGFNGQRDVVNQLLLCGADDTIKGCPENEPPTTPALACRRNRQPGLADLLDTERELRNVPDDPDVSEQQAVMTTPAPVTFINKRLRRELARELTMDEYREGIRALSKPKQTVA